ncbi:hypothetical protein BJ912DRAFT_1005059 [Pholiota molesta]|nr:hypothetical protein BJ912DRAFT_1005059 [Pholiota molesta]
MFSKSSLFNDHGNETVVERQVRFNPDEQHFLAVTDYSGSPSPSESPLKQSPTATLTPEMLDARLNQVVHAHNRSNSDDSWGTISLFNIDSPQEARQAPLMSASMLDAQGIHWNIHGSRTSTVNDGECATLSRGVRQIMLHSDKLHRNILVTPKPIDSFITIGRVYDVIREALDTQVSVNSNLFEEQCTEMKRAIWESSRRRSQNSELGIKHVQWIDFLLDYHIVVGISTTTGSEYWFVHFDKAESL